MPHPDPYGPALYHRLMKRLALEGRGDLRAAFLKNCGADDDQHPNCGEEDEGAQSCNHRFNPSWESQTKVDPVCSTLAKRSGEAA
jgi:hypothetical protein